MRFLATLWLLAGNISCAAPASNIDNLEGRQSADRLVFCHFMIGIVGERTSPADYDDDMLRAKSLGIDAFALNIGVDGYTDAQLNLAYQSAANNDMKVFISFDFNWYSPTSGASAVGSKIAQYANHPAQLMVDGKVFASSFAGDALDVDTMRSTAGVPVFWAPNFHPGEGDFSKIDGALNWMAWPNNGNNKAPTPGANVTVQAGDEAYISTLAGKPYIAPVSAWFSTHFGPEVPYSKNWIFPSDLLWFNRWNEVLTLGSRFLEIVTWNDYGESHYIGPLKSLHFDDGNSKWVNDMPHDGWLDMAKPFIAAYHAGAESVDSTLPLINSSTANNSSGNYFKGRPDGWEDMQDSVFVVAFLTAPGTVTIISGENYQTFDAPAGASSFQVDMQVGIQSFALTRGSNVVLSGSSLKDVSSICICGIYNFNAFVGTLPPGPSDSLQHDGLTSLTAGLHVSTCFPSPSLPATPPPPPTNLPTTSGMYTSPPPLSTKITSPTQSTKTTSPVSPTTSIPVPSTTKTTPPASTSSINPSGGSTCIAGTGPGNHVGLCVFSCQYGYCPLGPCICTAYGAGIPAPPVTANPGYPLPGEYNTYLGLCSFCCSHGYCPPTACAQG
ncbi:hypothetical protein V500_03045 [Pseudogymnoascus sp. VKM F-4518 (FW-2643)]|nr:hypothetical protein V500_03045 [Pseudogymnoascus sp. VKM F-4518 (FW-2643)]